VFVNIFFLIVTYIFGGHIASNNNEIIKKEQTHKHI